MWFDRVQKTNFGLSFLLSPMSDQALRMKIVDRLLRDPREFGLLRQHFVNNPSNPRQWVFLAIKAIAPLAGHELDSANARKRIDAAIDEYVDRFALAAKTIWPLLP